MPSKQRKKRDAKRETYLSNIQSDNADDNRIIDENDQSNSPSIQLSALTMSEEANCIENSPISLTQQSGGRPRKRQVSIRCNQTPKRAGGRPKKRKAGPGRGHRSSSSSCANSPLPVLDQPSLPQNEQMCLTGSNSEPLSITEGPLMISEGHVVQPELFASRNELLNLWNNENEMCDDRVIYAYLRYLASINNDKRVVVVAPFYTDPNVHYGPGAINLELNDHCYNHTADYDVLLVPVVFPGHFTLTIFDRSNREQLLCCFIDSLPPVQNLTADFNNRLNDSRFPGFDQNRVNLLTQIICQLTPDLEPSAFEIQIVPPNEYTCQLDGINCGFFTILYAESYLMNNRCLFLPNLDINTERKEFFHNSPNYFYQTQLNIFRGIQMDNKILDKETIF
ncbi:hypothetical protein niasHT_012269 [Heterodera trifolii]|uniref:Ubiquitin-like protease family profile domain-containing protein n=1 Tax=Heterodera trifolii TaxID=157864 RepID=A0ABD2KY36_9BILA